MSLRFPSFTPAPAASALALAVGLAGAAGAATIEVTQIKTTVEVNRGVGDLVPHQENFKASGLGEDTSGQVQSSGTRNVPDHYIVGALARQDGAGNSFAQVTGFTYSPEQTSYSYAATTRIDYRITNDGDTAEVVSFDYHVKGVEAQFENVNQYGNPFTDGTGAGGVAMRYAIGTSVWDDDAFDYVTRWLYQADYEGWSYALDDGAGFSQYTEGQVRGWSPTATALQSDGFIYGWKVTIADEIGRITFGELAPGESLSFYVISSAEALTDDTEPYVLAQIGDPNAFSTDPGDPPLDPVPLPAAGLMLAGGLGLMAALRRRRQTSVSS